MGHKVQNSKNENHEIIELMLFLEISLRGRKLSLVLGHRRRLEGSENKDIK